MILRSGQRILPRRLNDLACFLLVAVFAPITYIFQITVVLPELMEIGSLGYIVLWCAGLFLIFNVTSNMLACMLVETSIKRELLKPPAEPHLLSLWHMCDHCQALVPPRSWHCDVCNVCVLKRDHHCVFTGCCIGHHNFRYFFYFMLYMSIGSFVSVITCSIYLWYLHGDFYLRFRTMFTLLAPAVSLSLSLRWENLYLFIYMLCILCFAISTSLLTYHVSIFQYGAVTYERGSNRYNLGLRKNVEMVLGKRMFLTWLSPFVRSELPHDGINWVPRIEAKED